jgi:general secretion pathway protein G
MPFPHPSMTISSRSLDADRLPARRNRPGFTLIEILVVIVVIAILATLVAPNVFRHVGAAKATTAKSQIEMLGAALDAYRLDTGTYPSTEQGLQALQVAPTSAPANWRGPYLKKDVPRDPWGHAYVYKSPGEVNPTSYDLLSYGEDGQPGGDGDAADIVSWK